MNVPIKSGLLALFVLLSSCADITRSLPPSGAGSSAPPAMLRQVLPTETDPAITIRFEAHIAINPSPTLAARNKLIVVLPATNGLASQYQKLLKLGSNKGFHVIGLNYPNSTTIDTFCGKNTDLSCFENVRKEIITGSERSTLVDVNAPNSIVNRLEKAVAYLSLQYPTEGWGQYLSNGHMVWSKVRLVGHSQGGGHAALMSKMYVMDRAVYLSSPADWNYIARGPAAWMSQKNLTPATNQYVFTHLQDPVVNYANMPAIVQAMGLSGAAVSVDTSAAPYANTRFLSTNAAPNTSTAVAQPYHSITVIDAAVPLASDGTAKFEPAWGYLVFP
jgi:hypothetical protein